jgi:hypothetical protein
VSKALSSRRAADPSVGCDPDATHSRTIVANAEYRGGGQGNAGSVATDGSTGLGAAVGSDTGGTTGGGGGGGGVAVGGGAAVVGVGSAAGAAPAVGGPGGASRVQLPETIAVTRMSSLPSARAVDPLTSMSIRCSFSVRSGCGPVGRGCADGHVKPWSVRIVLVFLAAAPGPCSLSDRLL